MHGDNVRFWRPLLLLLPLLLVLLGLGFPRDAFLEGESSVLMPFVTAPVAPPDSINVQLVATLPYLPQPPTTFDAVTDIASAGDERLFLAQQSGRIWILDGNGTLVGEPFLDITDRIYTGNFWERGLLGLAFHPNYANNGFFYVAYTGFSDNFYIERFTVSATNPNRADPDSELRIISWDVLSESHHGGDLVFGTDGMLYISTGDSGPDPQQGSGEPGDWDATNPDNTNNSQRINGDTFGARSAALLGKILRIDVDRPNDLTIDCALTRDPAKSAYGIPPGNPFADGPDGNCDEIWAYGLRNPWRFSIDKYTGDMYIADVGEWLEEEINYIPAGTPPGLNFGWHCREGYINYADLFPVIADDCVGQVFTPPVHSYEHATHPGASVTGGFVYRGSDIPGLNGHYLFADFSGGKIWRISAQDGWQPHLLYSQGGLLISTFGEDADGELYLGTWQAQGPGKLYRILPGNG